MDQKIDIVSAYGINNDTIIFQDKEGLISLGLARYELGEKEQACEDFRKAIELGFSVLRVAEQQRCPEFWDE